MQNGLILCKNWDMDMIKILSQLGLSTDPPHHKGKIFRSPNILIINFHTKRRPFYIFGHPAWLKYPFCLVYPFKSKSFQGTQYFDHIIISQFSPKARPFCFFGHPVCLKQPFISFVYPFLIKGSTNAPLHKGRTFQETQYFDHTHISPFLHQKKAILHFLDTLYG